MTSSRSRTDSAKPAQGEKIQASRGETPDERLIVVTCPSDTGTETHEHERASKKGKTTRNATLAHTNYSKTVHTGKADRPDTGSDNYPTRWTQLTCPRIKVYPKTLLYLRPQEFRAATQWRVISPAKPKQAGCHAASAIKPGTPTQGSSWPPNSEKSICSPISVSFAPYRSRHTRALSLRMTVTTPKNIVVIGGGIVGTSTAYFLAISAARSPETRITLVEGTRIAAAASGYSGGFLAKDWHGAATASGCPLWPVSHHADRVSGWASRQ